MILYVILFVVLSMLLIFSAGFAVKYYMYATDYERERNAAYFLLAEKIGEDKAVMEIATLSLQVEGFEEREILENKMLDSETEKVRVDVVEAMHQYRRYY